jgi:hypothetical protein
MPVEEKIKRCLERHPEWTTKRIANSSGTIQAAVESIRGGGPIGADPASASATPLPPSGGFSLRGVRLLSKKPADCMKARLYGLHRGMGYRIADLSSKWGISEDTIRTHAKRFGSLVFVEATPGEYVACVVHPETPKGD